MPYLERQVILFLKATLPIKPAKITFANRALGFPGSWEGRYDPRKEKGKP